MEKSISVERSLEAHRTKKAIEHLLGLIEGIIADGQLHDLEIKMLSTWLSSNTECFNKWPGNAIAMAMQEVLADGVITEVERSYLLDMFKKLINTDFTETGSATAEVTSYPNDDGRDICFNGLTVCMTGEFAFGTRAACEKITVKAGGLPIANVTKKLDVLIVGAMVNSDWAHTSFGRKIQKAVEMKNAGHPIKIISENKWAALLQA